MGFKTYQPIRKHLMGGGSALGLRSTDVAVLYQLADFANDDSSMTYVSNEKVAKTLQMHKRTVPRVVNRLDAAKVIDVLDGGSYRHIWVRHPDTWGWPEAEMQDLGHPGPWRTLADA